MKSLTVILSLVVASSFSSLNAADVIVDAVFSPRDFTTGDSLDYITGTLTIDIGNGTMNHSGGDSYNSVSTSSGGVNYEAFTFTSFSISSAVIINIVGAPDTGLAILSQGDFTLGSILTYDGATQDSPTAGGNIALVSIGNMTLSGEINSNGGSSTLTNANQAGANGGNVTLATGGVFDITDPVTITAKGGDAATKNNPKEAGSGGNITIYSDPVTGLTLDPSSYAPGDYGDTPVALGSFTTVDLTGITYLMAVPEPSSSLMVALSSLFFFSRRRRTAA